MAIKKIMNSNGELVPMQTVVRGETKSETIEKLEEIEILASLEDLTVKELKILCKEKEISITSKATKSEIIKTIQSKEIEL